MKAASIGILILALTGTVCSQSVPRCPRCRSGVGEAGAGCAAECADEWRNQSRLLTTSRARGLWKGLSGLVPSCFGVAAKAEDSDTTEKQVLGLSGSYDFTLSW
jgi:hypothetical protein